MVIEFLMKEGNSVAEIYRRLLNIYTDETDKSTMQRWMKMFDEGELLTNDTVGDHQLQPLIQIFIDWTI